MGKQASRGSAFRSTRAGSGGRCTRLTGERRAARRRPRHTVNPNAFSLSHPPAACRRRRRTRQPRRRRARPAAPAAASTPGRAGRGRLAGSGPCPGGVGAAAWRPKVVRTGLLRRRRRPLLTCRTARRAWLGHPVVNPDTVSALSQVTCACFKLTVCKQVNWCMAECAAQSCPSTTSRRKHGAKPLCAARAATAGLLLGLRLLWFRRCLPGPFAALLWRLPCPWAAAAAGRRWLPLGF